MCSLVSKLSLWALDYRVIHTVTLYTLTISDRRKDKVMNGRLVWWWHPLLSTFEYWVINKVTLCTFIILDPVENQVTNVNGTDLNMGHCAACWQNSAFSIGISGHKESDLVYFHDIRPGGKIKLWTTLHTESLPEAAYYSWGVCPWP